MDNSLTDVAEIIHTAIASTEPKVLAEGELLGVVVPGGGSLQLVDLAARLDQHAATPRRALGTHKAATVASFADVVERHHSLDTTIWVHPTSGQIVAVLNDHAQGEGARWGDHRVELELQQTEAWKRWRGNDGKLMDQQSFAEHIEDGLTEIAEPAGAELLEIAQTMHGTTTAAWKAGARLHDGSVKFAYTEDAAARAGEDGELTVPKDFVLYMPLFVGEPSVRVDAHLRWRSRNGGLQIGYKLDNPEQLVQNVLQGVADRLAAQFSAVYLGSPRS